MRPGYAAWRVVQPGRDPCRGKYASCLAYLSRRIEDATVLRREMEDLEHSPLRRMLLVVARKAADPSRRVSMMGMKPMKPSRLYTVTEVARHEAYTTSIPYLQLNWKTR